MARVIRAFMHREVYPLEPDFLTGSFRHMLPVLEERGIPDLTGFITHFSA
jgi:hypothetical protein